MSLRGTFVPGALLLLDNRTREGRFGYEALGVVALASGGYALANRGWVAGDPARRALPEVARPIMLRIMTTTRAPMGMRRSSLKVF